MTVILTVHGAHDEQTELLSLRQWLQNEPTFRGASSIRTEPVQPGTMGGVGTTLTVAVASGGALTVLANTISVWLQQRRSSLHVKLVKPDGSTTIIATGPAADKLARRIHEQDNNPNPNPDQPWLE